MCSIATTITDLISQLYSEFAIKDLGSLNFFLGIKVIQHSRITYLSQQWYILDPLTRTKKGYAKPIASPMATSTSLSTFERTIFYDTTLYRITIRALQYLCITRPDIAFIVNKLSQFMHKPLVPHWQVVKRLMCYLKQTMSFGLQFQHSS